MNNWIGRTALDDGDVFSFLAKWMDYYNLKDYDLTIIDGCTSLRIVKNGVPYIAVPEPDSERLRILSVNMAGKSKGKGFHVVKSFGENGYVYGDNCWVRFFKEVTKK